MRGILPHADRLSPLNRVSRPTPAKANLAINFVEDSARRFRQAIARTGMNQDEAMRALGVEDKGYFSRMLDGKEKLWVHQLLRSEAAPILRELLVVLMLDHGECSVERVIRITESKGNR